ncbi:hypothetical protein LINPERPRIM_LOCUS15284 [Linum perenne]
MRRCKGIGAEDRSSTPHYFFPG